MLVMVAAGILVVSFTQQIGTFLDASLLSEPWQQGVVVLAVLWFGAAMSLLRMRLTQNYVNLQFFFYAAALFLMGLAGVVWLLGGNASANSFAPELWNPLQGDTVVLGLPGYLTFYSFAILALLGIEVPLNMGVEVTGGEGAIRKYLFWGCGIVMAAYLWTTWGNMVTVPVGEVNGTTGGAQGVGVAMGDAFGIIVALILLWFFVTASMVYNYSFARLLFVSGLEKRLPPAIGRVNKNKVPANAVLLQTGLATVVTVILFFIIGGAGGDPNKPYFALLGSLNIIWCISTALLFADIFFARKADPARFEQARRVNQGFLYTCGAVGLLANLAAVFFIFTGTWYPPGFPTLGEWNTWLAIFSIIAIVGGLVIWFISEGMRGGKTDTELVAEIAAEVGVTGLGNPGPMA
jgi:amino acid transporter